jgi:Fe-Mn family superoxide dismutase
MENENSRRAFLKNAALFAAGATLIGSNKLNATEKLTELLHNTQFTLPPLPYSTDALEPHIDKMTMEIHHDKHHQAYITNLNKEIEKLNLGHATIEGFFDKMGEYNATIRNNAGGHFNHSMFWTMMKPNGGGEPKGKIADAIKTNFSSIVDFKKQFADAAMKRFGSGWAWLVKTKEGKLVISSTANQDNPLMNLTEIEIKGKPVLAIDVWEHAYYLKNQNRRADYIASFWNVVNWEAAEALFVA